MEDRTWCRCSETISVSCFVRFNIHNNPFQTEPSSFVSPLNALIHANVSKRSAMYTSHAERPMTLTGVGFGHLTYNTCLQGPAYNAPLDVLQSRVTEESILQ